MTHQQQLDDLASRFANENLCHRLEKQRADMLEERLSKAISLLQQSESFCISHLHLIGAGEILRKKIADFLNHKTQ